MAGDMSRADLTEDKRRAEKARLFLDEPVVAEAFAAVEQAYLERLLQLGVADDRRRYRLTEAIKIVREVQRQLSVTAERGIYADHELARIQRGRWL